MPTALRNLVFALILTLLATSALAGPAGQAADQAVEPAPEPAETAPALGSRLEPTGEMKVLRETFLTELAELQTAFAAATDPERAFELQRAIGALKLRHEIRLYQIQLDRLASKGPSEERTQLTSTIEALEAALQRIAPGDEPTPSEEGR